MPELNDLKNNLAPITVVRGPISIIFWYRTELATKDNIEKLTELEFEPVANMQRVVQDIKVNAFESLEVAAQQLKPVRGRKKTDALADLGSAQSEEEFQAKLDADLAKMQEAELATTRLLARKLSLFVGKTDITDNGAATPTTPEFFEENLSRDLMKQALDAIGKEMAGPLGQESESSG
jgi:hypothetical protein